MNVFNSISAGFESIFKSYWSSSFPAYRPASCDQKALLGDFYAVQNDFRTGVKKVVDNDNQSRRKKNSKTKR